MNETIDARLGEAGIAPHDVQTRLDGRGKAFVITARELVYADDSGIQRASLREVSKVASGKTGALAVTAPSGTLIEASVRGFDVSELKQFFDAVKTAIARAKASGTGEGPVRATDPAAPTGYETPGFTTTVMPVSQPASVEPSGIAAQPNDPLPTDDPWGEAPARRLDDEQGPGLEGRDSPPRVVDEPEDPWADPVAAGDASWSDPLSNAPAALPERPGQDDAWSGERLEPAAAFEPAASRHPTLATAGNSLDSTAGILRAAAFLVGLVGVAGGALIAQGATGTMEYLTAAAWLVGGVTVALIAFTVAELARVAGRSAADLQAVRRATLGH